MFSGRPNQSPLAPISEVLGSALVLYQRNALSFIAASTFGALAGNAVGLVFQPTDRLLMILWTQFTLAVIIALQSPAVYLVIRASRNEQASRAAVIGALITFGPRFFTFGLIISLTIGLLSLSSFGLILAVYLAIRVTLVAPAIVLEGLSVSGGMRRSWQLVQGRWLRTFVVVFIVTVFAGMLMFAAASLPAVGDQALITLIAVSIAQGLSAPLVTLVESLMFEEYRQSAEKSLP